MAAVQLKAIQKTFGNTLVLHEVDLQIKSAEFLVLVGPSGCGKSTLLRIIAGLEEPSQGEIWIDSRQVNSLSPKERGIAMVFQNYALYPHMTVAENISFSLRLSKMSKEEIGKRIQEVAQILGIEAHLQKRPHQLSGGQKQRVAMGRAMVRKPKVFLFDEPLSNLDAHLRVKMRAEISALHRRLGCTVIYVTHDQSEAMTLADRIAVVHQGRLEQIGSPEEVYHCPKTRFVASFIGTPSMNFLENQEKLSFFPKETEWIGIRPENLFLQKKTKEKISSVQEKYFVAGEAQVTWVERLGNLTYIHCSMKGKNIIVQQAPQEQAPKQEEIVTILAEKEAALCFDKKEIRIDSLR